MNNATASRTRVRRELARIRAVNIVLVMIAAAAGLATIGETPLPGLPPICR